MTLKIWLDLDCFSFFEKGTVTLSEEHTEELYSYFHRGMLVDTELVGTAKGMARGKFLLRWYVRGGGIDFYGIDAEINSIYFVNSSKVPIRIDKYGIIESGCSITIYPNKS